MRAIDPVNDRITNVPQEAIIVKVFVVMLAILNHYLI